MPCEEQHRFSVRLPAQPGSARVARDRISGLLTAAGADPGAHLGVMLAVTEACTNAAVHAHPDGAPEDFELHAQVERGVLRVVVRDYGVGIGAAPPRPGEPGLGLMLIRAHAIQCEIRRSTPGTEVTMTFTLAGP